MGTDTSTERINLTRWLIEQERDHGRIPVSLRMLIEQVARACQRISRAVSRAASSDILGSLGSENVQGEVQKKLDVIANDVLLQANEWGGHLAAMASEELETIHIIPHRFPRGEYLLMFDPLDGSSNIDVNVTIGTIFSVLHLAEGVTEVGPEHFLQPGHKQVAAGYCTYGPQTTLMLTLGHGVAEFNLDFDEGGFVLARENVQIPRATREFSINMSNLRHWAAPVRRYIDECLAGSEGPRGKDFNMRWVGSMVADVHRVLSRGGVFLYPWDAREPDRAGKLRLMYEANPMAFLVEQAGGMAIAGTERILDIAPTGLHQRAAVMLGSSEEVNLLHRYHVEETTGKAPAIG